VKQAPGRTPRLYINVFTHISVRQVEGKEIVVQKTFKLVQSVHLNKNVGGGKVVVQCASWPANIVV
jgi:hypothetical protein